jgi:hypothetical protein
MKRSDLWPSRFLKAEDLQGRSINVTIERAVSEVLKNGKGEETKVVIYFQKAKKALVCNMTNFDSIVDVTGIDDSDKWAGHKIQLYPTTTVMSGKPTPCIRVRQPGPPSSNVTQPPPNEPPPDESDESIPFQEG